MVLRTHVHLGDRSVHIVTTERIDGDYSVTGAGVGARRESLLGSPVTWLDLRHGTDVITVAGPGEGEGSPADAAVTRRAGTILSVTTADCMPLVLTSSDGIAVIHAGWRGLMAGVVQAAAAQLLSSRGTPLASWCGPCISPDVYAFSPCDLEAVVASIGETARASTSHGEPALDLFGAVRTVLRRVAWPLPEARPPSTADDRFFSHRVRSDPERMMTAAWISHG